MRRVVDKTGKELVLLAGAIAIVVGCFAAYMPAILQGGFIWDDDLYVTDNPALTAPDGLRQIWLSMAPPPPQYVPLVYTTICTTFWIEHQLWGFNPAGYHAVNVGIHCINVLLLWVILRRLGIPGAWLASAIFALHPVQVESVAWITERKNVLMAFFGLLMVLCWVEYVFGNKDGRKAILLYAGSLLFCALANLSKATACTIPAALVLILWLKGSPITVKCLLEIVPYVAIGFGTGLLVIWRESRLGTGFLNLGLQAADKIIIAGRALWFYLWKLVWPVNLTFSYPRWNIDATDAWQYGWPVSFAAVIVVGWLLRKRTGRGIMTGIIFFPAMLFPMLGFFSLYTFVYTFVADHYQYLACIGPIAIVAGIAGTVYRKSGENAKFIIAAAAGVLLITLGVLTWRQCGIYKDSDTLWADTLEKNPDSWMAHGYIGLSLFKQGKFDEALIHYDKQLELASYLKKIHPMAYSDVYYHKALIFSAKDRLGDAAEQYKKSLEVDNNSALVHYCLANILVKQGKVEEAKAHYRQGLEIARTKGAKNLAADISRQLEAVEKQKTENR
ncbi:MAG: tetratricopeptide repeat protein [Sedimentisphaerales bacterium]|jgi:tetratricopeptide (TPR) repeat protein